MCSVDPWLCNSNELRRRRGRSSLCSLWLGIGRGTLKGEGGRCRKFQTVNDFKKLRVIEIVESGFNGEFSVGTARVTNDLPRDNKSKTTTLLIFSRIFS